MLSLLINIFLFSANDTFGFVHVDMSVGFPVVDRVIGKLCFKYV